LQLGDGVLEPIEIAFGLGLAFVFGMGVLLFRADSQAVRKEE
jgi:hypothetical protein